MMDGCMPHGAPRPCCAGCWGAALAVACRSAITVAAINPVHLDPARAVPKYLGPYDVKATDCAAGKGCYG